MQIINQNWGENIIKTYGPNPTLEGLLQQVWRRGENITSVFGGKNPDNFSSTPFKTHHYWAKECLKKS